MKVTIRKTSMFSSVVICADNVEKSVTLDYKPISYDPEKLVYHVFDMTRGWPNHLINDDIIDGKSYSVKIEDGDKLESFVFQNKFPPNIYRLIDLIRDVQRVGAR